MMAPLCAAEGGAPSAREGAHSPDCNRPWRATYGLASVLVLGRDAAVGRNISDDGLGQVVDEGKADALVCIHRLVPIQEKGHHGHPVHVAGHRLAASDARKRPSPTVSLLDEVGVL